MGSCSRARRRGRAAERGFADTGAHDGGCYGAGVTGKRATADGRERESKCEAQTSRPEGESAVEARQRDRGLLKCTASAAVNNARRRMCGTCFAPGSGHVAVLLHSTQCARPLYLCPSWRDVEAHLAHLAEFSVRAIQHGGARGWWLVPASGKRHRAVHVIPRSHPSPNSAASSASSRRSSHASFDNGLRIRRRGH